MGSNLSVQEKIHKCAKGNDAVQLQDIIRQLVSAAADVKQYIEWQDLNGHTPLVAACNRGNYACVELLLRHGANLHHFTRLPEGSTALHEAVARTNLRIAELLLQYGANPFMENGRGLTCVDIAINRNHVAMVRSLELRSHFTGTLLLKVSKYMGLGAEWKQRWVVVMPRYQASNQGGTNAPRIARSLLVCYRARDQCEPTCKVWLDGSVARSVTGSLGSGFLQCALSLHRNHAAASGALMTGDASSGYTMHLRPPDSTPQGAQALRQFMEIVNGSRVVPQPQQQPSTPSAQAPGHSRTSSAQASHDTPTHSHSASDEEMARRLQAQYDAEYNGNAPRAKQPPSPIRTRANGRTEHPLVGMASSSASPTSSAHQLNTRPSAPLYPTIDPTTYSTPPSGVQGSQQPPLDGSWMWGTGQPQSSSQVQGGPTNANGVHDVPATTPQPAPQGQASAPGQRLDDDEAGNCVICMSAPATAGFLHGESVHKCCCKECAKGFKAVPAPACPMCRMPIEHIIFNFY